MTKRLIVSTGISMLVAALAGCGQSLGEYGGDPAGGADRGGDPSPDPDQGPPLEPGQLTAAEWDDNLYFDFFLDALADLRGQSELPVVPLADRVVLTVTTSDRAPIAGAQVEIAAAGDAVITLPTASDGRLLFFPEHDGAPAGAALSARVTLPDGQTASFDLPANTSDVQLVVEGAEPVLPGALDIAFVIDATGSMGDELEYIAAEITDIADRIRAMHSDLSIRFALIVYRDQGDEYVTRSFDFTTELEQFRADLDRQVADGGGDYPEAMDRALIEMNQLGWRSGAVARVAFLIADAPPHEQGAKPFLEAARASRRAGIKIYPVAASGVAREAEYLMRIAAQTTLARYLFLTDDSGIGEPHEEPHIPCYRVELLNGLLVRTILSELAGAYLPPEQGDIIRTSGEYQDGLCVISPGETQPTP